MTNDILVLRFINKNLFFRWFPISKGEWQEKSKSASTRIQDA